MGLSARDVAVSDCPQNWDDDYIRKLTRSDLGLFLPEVASTAEGLSLQAKAYPKMKWEEQKVAESVRNVDEEDNVINLFGWMRTEKSIKAPHTGTDEAKAKEIIARKNRLFQTLNVYGEAGQVSKLLQGQYLDEVITWVRILSSRIGGRVLDANFNSDGYCNVNWNLKPVNVNDSLGVRSVGVSGNFRRYLHLRRYLLFCGKLWRKIYMKRILKEIIHKLAGPKLSKAQWSFLASSARTFGDGILLGGSAAFFLPETFQLREPISLERFVSLIFSGLLLIALGVILVEKGEK